MTAMKQAMEAAGVPLPTLKERLWRIVKEQPGITMKELHARMRDTPRGSISSQLHVMQGRGMIYTKPSGRSYRGREIIGLHTDLATYTLMPPSTTRKPPVIHLVEPATAKPTTADDLRKFVDNLTVAQARELFNHLKRMFT